MSLLTTLFITQLESEKWATNSLAVALQEASEPEPRSLLLFSHIAVAYHNWFNRIMGNPNMLKPFEERTINESLQLYNEVLDAVIQYVKSASENDFEKVIEFSFGVDGSKRTMSIANIMVQMITHSYYHRGQIIAQLKGKLEPLPLLTHIVFASTKVE